MGRPLSKLLALESGRIEFNLIWVFATVIDTFKHNLSHYQGVLDVLCSKNQSRFVWACDKKTRKSTSWGGNTHIPHLKPSASDIIELVSIQVAVDIAGSFEIIFDGNFYK
ncbi:protein of unknown function [Methylorubrum extorquens]|uniref:Uncharacterized protein n=1 Tax=Methylorubrum extorquens TaxID=408 RepID=A0A2N9AIH4_METEX|nr:protein of unknown function [Methylorubrum extorquens]